MTAIFCLWNVSPIYPEIFSQHTGIPLVFVPLFHGGNILMKLLSVFVAHCPEIFWEEV
jgi:hypothetical protein